MLADVLHLQLRFHRMDLFHIVPVRIPASLEDLLFVVEHEGCVIGHPRPDAQDGPLLRGIQVNRPLHLGPGSHQAHVAQEHVDELRQLVELVSAEEPAYPGYPGIVLGGGCPAQLIGIDHHGPELENAERPAVQADALAAVEDGAVVFAFDRYGYPQKNRAEKI